MFRIQAKAFGYDLKQVLLAAAMNALYNAKNCGNPEYFYARRDRFPYGWGYYES